MRRWGALPEPGGLLDQEERTIALLDLIDETREDWERMNREQEEKTAAMRRDALARERARGRFGGY